jgi:hypothetical protein
VRAAWWHERQDEVVDGFLVEPQNQGRAGTTWEPSHEWRLGEATPSSRRLQWFTRKPLGYSVEPQNRGRRPDEEVWPTQVGSTAQEGRSDRLGRSDCPGRSNHPGGGLTALVAAPRCFEAKDTRRDRKACIEAKHVAVAGYPSDEENLKTSKFALEGLLFLVLSKGSLVFWVPPYILIEWMDGSQILGTLAHLFFHFRSLFP